MATNLDWMRKNPIAHRAFHNAENGIYENTLSACAAAIENGFSIEVDMHLSSDGKPVIFHDPTLKRMTGLKRNIREMTSQELRQVRIHESNDHVATLDELLELTDGRTGLVLEMKGLAGQDEGFLQAVANSLKNYHGPVAIMSFFHWLLKDARKFAPDVPLGLTAQGDDNFYSSHKMIADECSIDFLAYKVDDLPCKFANDFRETGKPLICWTVNSKEKLVTAARFSDQPTFERIDPYSV